MRGKRAFAVTAAAVFALFASASAATASASRPVDLPLPTALPTLPPTPGPVPTPPPTPIPLPTLPATVPPVPTLPALPGPTPGGGGQPPGAVPGNVLPSGSPALPGGTPSPTASGAARAADGGAVIAPLGSTSAVLSDLLGLLGTPPNVGVERPTLEHFGPDVQPATIAAAAAAAARDITPAPAGGPGPGLLVLACSLLAGCGIALVGARGRPRWHRRAGMAALPLAFALGLTAVATSPATPSGSPTSAPLATTPPAAFAGVAAPVTRRVPGVGYELLARVAGFENAIAHQSGQLSLIGALLQQPAGAADPAAGHLGRTPVDLAAEQHRLAVSLESSLQAEYDFYAATAQDPGRASALVAAASSQPASVRDAVAYDVQAVQASLAQQAAITQAAEVPAGRPVIAAPAGSAGAVEGASTGSFTLSTPLAGAVTQGFGPSPLVFEPAVRLGGITYPHFHTGLDIAAPAGSPVRAAGDGVVALAGAETDGRGHLVGFGNYVVIAHGGGMVTLYGHLDALLVRAGQAVTRTDAIGLEGSTGNSTGPHLHFEVRVGGSPVDPFSYLR